MIPFGCPVTIFNTLDPLGKKSKFEGRKLESEVHVSPSSSAQTKQHDDKTKIEAKGMSPIESLTGYTNLSAEFEDFSDKSINEVNATESLVPAVGFQRGKIDQTLFIKRKKGDILLVQIYVDDIIFGLQVKQKPDGIFISQDKYVAEILRKFGLTDGKSASTLIDTKKPLLKDPDGEDVDVYIYRSMIGSLMYLTSSRPDIMFAVCACARF
nr:hypothetical protein [Tanacetum cinerariifolium]